MCVLQVMFSCAQGNSCDTTSVGYHERAPPKEWLPVDPERRGGCVRP